MGVSRPSLHIDYDEMHAMAHFMFSCGSLSFLGAENQGRSGRPAQHKIKQVWPSLDCDVDDLYQ